MGHCKSKILSVAVLVCSSVYSGHRMFRCMMFPHVACTLEIVQVEACLNSRTGDVRNFTNDTVSHKLLVNRRCV